MNRSADGTPLRKGTLSPAQAAKEAADAAVAAEAAEKAKLDETADAKPSAHHEFEQVPPLPRSGPVWTPI